MPPLDNNVLWAAVILVVIGALLFAARLAITTTKTLVRLDALMPVMLAMAAQFKSDSGSTLKDQINSLEQSAARSKEVAQNARLAAQDLKTSVEIIRMEQVRLTAAAERVAQFTANMVQSAPLTQAAGDVNRVDVSGKARQIAAGAAIEQAQKGVEATKEGVETIEKGINQIAEASK